MIRFSILVLVVCLGLCAGCNSTNSIPAVRAPCVIQRQNTPMQPKTSTSNPVRIVVALPLRNQEPLKQFLSKLSDPSSGRYHHFLTREQFAASYAPDSADLQKVASQLAQSGLQSKIGNLAVFATGSGQCVGAYFQTPIDEVRYETSIGAVVKPVARGSLHLSPLLRSLSASIIGLERIPPAEPLSLRGPSLDPRLDPQNIHGPYGPYMTDDLKQAYRFPSALDVNGDGVTIATVMAGAVHRADIDYYAHAVLHQSSFRFAMVDIDGGAGFDPNAGSAESTLDLEQAGGIAPRSDIILYNIPNLSPYYNYLAYDAAYSNKRVLVVNSSFGQCEKDFASAQGVSELKSFDDLFAAGSAVGVTWVAASGDQAAYGCPDGVYNKISVEFPASDPYILAVGGTNLTTAHSHGSRNSAYISESAYYEPRGGGAYWGSGGGQSRLFRVPSWQRDFIRPFIRRGVPDLALHMGGLGFSSGGSYCGALKCHIDDSSDWLRLAGRWTQVIGTSAASPDIVGLIALRIEKQRSALGDIHTWLYDEARHARVFRRGIHGFNGYRTSRGLWDPVLGTGTPFGNTFAGTASVAGTPGTPSNP